MLPLRVVDPMTTESTAVSAATMPSEAIADPDPEVSKTAAQKSESATSAEAAPP
jgi:hypothetical protein